MKVTISQFFLDEIWPLAPEGGVAGDLAIDGHHVSAPGVSQRHHCRAASQNKPAENRILRIRIRIKVISWIQIRINLKKTRAYPFLRF
jgi:hypothetical protein